MSWFWLWFWKPFAEVLGVIAFLVAIFVLYLVGAFIYICWRDFRGWLKRRLAR